MNTNAILEALRELRYRIEGYVPFEQAAYIGSLFDQCSDALDAARPTERDAMTDIQWHESAMALAMRFAEELAAVPSHRSIRPTSVTLAYGVLADHLRSRPEDVAIASPPDLPEIDMPVGEAINYWRTSARQNWVATNRLLARNDAAIALLREARDIFDYVVPFTEKHCWQTIEIVRGRIDALLAEKEPK